MMGTYAAIRAIASYLPEKIEPNDPANPIGKKVGIDERHVAADDEAASDVAIRAAENLFAAYDIRPADIDFVLLCAQTPDYFLPTTACIVQDRLGIPQSAGALDYNLACSAYPYGLAMAKGIIETGMAKNILLLASSVRCSAMLARRHSSRLWKAIIRCSTALSLAPMAPATTR